jgi:hypothetical protein
MFNYGNIKTPWATIGAGARQFSFKIRRSRASSSPAFSLFRSVKVTLLGFSSNSCQLLLKFSITSELTSQIEQL